eukprot:6605006-Pyramimonas_sp.AAC.1
MVCLLPTRLTSRAPGRSSDDCAAEASNGGKFFRFLAESFRLFQRIPFETLQRSLGYQQCRESGAPCREFSKQVELAAGRDQ